ncbi:hypothetical protein ACIGW3_23855 [Streptomyces sp. NPDC053499]|uniref:hypothetical protein n=1 Tax=Streptomyces sp. NPDC053499 TaxID=3365707 RepID=UPI0037D41737
MTSFRKIMKTDPSVLTDLAKKWDSVVEDTRGLPGQILRELMKPLRDEGYWEGAAAPYAWQMIDDMQHQVHRAREVAKKVKKLLEDGASELEEIRTDLKSAVKDIEADPMLRVSDDGVVQCTVSGTVSPGNKSTMESAQKKIDSIVRRAVLKDKQLSYTLMADIGLDQWFNARPQHTQINSTGKISNAEYTALDRVLVGNKTGYTNDNTGPYEIGGHWLSGTGPKKHEFSDNDSLTKLITNSKSMEGVRKDVAEQVADGKLKGKARYSIAEGGLMGAGKQLLMKDIPAIATNDKDGLGQAFVGSYTVNYRVVGEDADGEKVVRYTLQNNTSTSSFMHFLGYGKWLEKFNHDKDGFPGRTSQLTGTYEGPSGSRITLSGGENDKGKARVEDWPMDFSDVDSEGNHGDKFSASGSWRYSLEQYAGEKDFYSQIQLHFSEVDAPPQDLEVGGSRDNPVLFFQPDPDSCPNLVFHQRRAS